MTRIILGVMGGIEMHYLDATYYRLNLLEERKDKDWFIEVMEL